MIDDSVSLSKGSFIIITIYYYSSSGRRRKYLYAHKNGYVVSIDRSTDMTKTRKPSLEVAPTTLVQQLEKKQ